MAFRGTFDYTLDSKNRLTVPAKFRDQLADGGVLAQGIESCVALYTPQAYEEYIAATLQGAHAASAQARQLKRFFAANSLDVELDAAGRIGLPAFLIEHAGLAKDVVVTGAEDCLEVWNRTTWADYNAKLVADISDITAQMGQESRETGA